MRKKILVSLIVAGLVAPQFLFAGERVIASSCTHWNLGLVSFWTGSSTVEVTNSDGSISTYEKPCGKTKWIWQSSQDVN